MAWENQDFRAYPAKCFRQHQLAVIQAPDDLLLGAWPSRATAASEALLFRKYRYLVRANPYVDLSADRLMDHYTYRTRLVQNDLGDWLLYLRAMPSIIGELLRLNPELHDIV